LVFRPSILRYPCAPIKYDGFEAGRPILPAGLPFAHKGCSTAIYILSVPPGVIEECHGGNRKSGGCEVTPEHAEIEAVPRNPRSKWTYLLYLAGAVTVVLIAAFLTLTVTFSDAPPGGSYPYITTYDVVFPNAEVVRLGNVEILAIPSNSSVLVTVNKKPEEIQVNELREISSRKASVSTLGFNVLEFDFRVSVVYQGQIGDDAHFYLLIKTSRQVPSSLLDFVIPPGIQARPA
jgi:hypothetical protein